MSKMKCPVCKGTGKITEDASEYVFETRSPQSDVCLICSGTGLIGPRKVLPDGVPAYLLAAKQSTKDLKDKHKIPGTTKATVSTKKDTDAAGRPFSGAKIKDETPIFDGEPVGIPDLEAAKELAMEIAEALKPELISVNIMIINVRGTSKACAELTANIAKLISE